MGTETEKDATAQKAVDEDLQNFSKKAQPSNQTGKEKPGRIKNRKDRKKKTKTHPPNTTPGESEQPGDEFPLEKKKIHKLSRHEKKGFRKKGGEKPSPRLVRGVVLWGAGKDSWKPGVKGDALQESKAGDSWKISRREGEKGPFENPSLEGSNGTRVRSFGGAT